MRPPRRRPGRVRSRPPSWRVCARPGPGHPDEGRRHRRLRRQTRSGRARARAHAGQEPGADPAIRLRGEVRRLRPETRSRRVLRDPVPAILDHYFPCRLCTEASFTVCGHCDVAGPISVHVTLSVSCLVVCDSSQCIEAHSAQRNRAALQSSSGRLFPIHALNQSSDGAVAERGKSAHHLKGTVKAKIVLCTCTCKRTADGLQALDQPIKRVGRSRMRFKR